jgi:hypothetical protein
MSLTKVSYSMITGAPVNAFDYMSAAQIADVQARTSLVDVSGAIQAAIDANPGREVFLPSGTYRCESPIVLGAGGSSHDILRGEGFPAYQTGTRLDFVGCNGIELEDSYQSISNLWITGDKSGGTVDPETLDFGYVGIYISGAGTASGSASGIMNVTVEGFDTGIATKDTSGFAGAYFILSNIVVLSCVVGYAITQQTTQFNVTGGTIRNCTKHGIYTGPALTEYQSVVFVDTLVENCGTTASPVNATAGICIRGVCKFGMFGGYLEQVRVFVDQFCSATFRKTWIQGSTRMWGQGEIDMSDAAGVEGQVISTDYDVSTYTNDNITVTYTNTGANPRCYRIQSTTAPGSDVRTRGLFGLTSAGDTNFNSISRLNTNSTLLGWVKVQFQVKYVNPLPTQLGELGDGSGFGLNIRINGYTGFDSQANSVNCDVDSFDVSDGEWHQVTIIKPIRAAAASTIQDTITTVQWWLDFANGNWDVSALDMYVKASTVTMYFNNGKTV